MSRAETLPVEADHDAPSAVLDRLATQLVDGIYQAGKEEPTTVLSADAEAFIRVVNGAPSDTEVAALIAVLAAASSSSPNPPHSPMSNLGEWGAPINQLRYGLSAAPAYFVNARYSR
ncbi:acyl-CoA carboxylase epsilon subunit [Rhodococcus erythropolis]|uniref:acyl-CoA carboxylase epsilon subunit n=1 Tax=Rhodococcus erythropolis TaxID=1833 RepID=UPI0003087DCC|nr:acyl-CoA carboxylase epsilon subunit [Rhodococcus erythropolis]